MAISINEQDTMALLAELFSHT